MTCAPRRSGGSGRALVLLAFPCLFAPAFLEATQPELTNYIPIIRHPAYDIGLIVAGVGRACAGRSSVAQSAGTARFRAAVCGRDVAWRLRLRSCVDCFGVATTLLAHAGELASREELFWGGGHVLQFVYAALMVTNWSLLARMSLGEEAVDNRIFLGSVGLIALIAIAAPAFYATFAPFSDHQREAFRFLQFGIAAPTLIFAFRLSPARVARPPMAMARSGFLRPCGVAGALRARRRDGLPDRRL